MFVCKTTCYKTNIRTLNGKEILSRNYLLTCDDEDAQYIKDNYKDMIVEIISDVVSGKKSVSSIKENK